MPQSNPNQQNCVMVHEGQGPNRERQPNFGDLAKMIPPFKDYMNNLHTYQYMQQQENPENVHPRHNHITQQYSSSTDEGCDGCDTDHGGMVEQI